MMGDYVPYHVIFMNRFYSNAFLVSGLFRDRQVESAIPSRHP